MLLPNFMSNQFQMFLFLSFEIFLKSPFNIIPVYLGGEVGILWREGPGIGFFIKDELTDFRYITMYYIIPSVTDFFKGYEFGFHDRFKEICTQGHLKRVLNTTHHSQNHKNSTEEDDGSLAQHRNR